MKHLTYPLLLVMLSFFLIGADKCCPDPDQDIQCDPDEMTYAPHATIIDNPEEQSSYQDTMSGIVCTVTDYKWAPGDEEAILMDPSSDIIYPGALVKAGSVQDGSYEPVTVSRTPITISHSATHKKTIVDNPTLSNVREKIIDIVKGENIAGGSFDYRIENIHSSDHLRMALRGNYKNTFLSVESNFNFEDQSKTRRTIVEMWQLYYTIDIDKKQRPSDWFVPDDYFCSQVNFMPVIVSSVKYGRMGMVTAESSMEQTKFDAQLKLLINALGNRSEIDWETDYRELLEKSDFKVIIVGGNPSKAAQSTSLQGFHDFITSGGQFSTESPGSPIGYKLAYLDGSIARMVKSGEYSVRECSEQPFDNNAVINVPSFKIFPSLVRGDDRNFGTERPLQYAKAEIAINELNNTLDLEVFYELTQYRNGNEVPNETKGSFSGIIYTWAPSNNGYDNYNISEILTDTEYHYEVIDTDESVNKYPSEKQKDELVSQFEFMGSTGSDDLPERTWSQCYFVINNNMPAETTMCNGNDFKNLSYLIVHFNPIEVRLSLDDL